MTDFGRDGAPAPPFKKDRDPPENYWQDKLNIKGGGGRALPDGRHYVPNISFELLMYSM